MPHHLQTCEIVDTAVTPLEKPSPSYPERAARPRMARGLGKNLFRCNGRRDGADCGSEGSEGSGFSLYYLPIFSLASHQSRRRNEHMRGSTMENHFLHFLHSQPHSDRINQHLGKSTPAHQGKRSSSWSAAHPLLPRTRDHVHLCPTLRTGRRARTWCATAPS